MNFGLINTYRALRQMGSSANVALRKARLMSGDNKTQYRRDAAYFIENYKGEASTNDYRAFGFRWIGWADELARIEHRGWYTDPYGEGVEGKIRGCVVALPGRNGTTRIYPACALNESGHGDHAITIDLGHGRDAEPVGSAYDRWDSNDVRDAAHAADSFAECAANDEREYQTAWEAGRIYADTRLEAEEYNKELRSIAKGLRDGVNMPDVIVETAMRNIAYTRRSRDKKLTQCERLKAGDYDELSFYASDARLIAAFNYGAGTVVL